LIAERLATPWTPGAGLYSLPGSLTLTLRLGEAPEEIPSQIDVRSRAVAPAVKFGCGQIDRMIRNFANGALISRVHAASASLGLRGKSHLKFNDREVVSGVSRVFRLDVEPGTPIGRLISALNEVSIVEHASPNYLTSAPFEAAPSGVTPATTPPAPPITLEQAWESRDLLCAREAMAYEPGDSGIIVAIVDCGVSPHHPEMANRFRAGFDTVQLGAGDFATGVKLLGDAAHADNKPIDRFVGHGMGCAGILGAVGNEIPPGLAGDCGLIPIRVLGAAELPGKRTPVGLGAISDIDMGLKMAVDLGATVLNMSFGTAERSLEPGAPKPHAEVVRYALDHGCILVAASGNSGQEEMYWPAAYDGVIAVGSVGADGKPSHFSTRGSHVALSATGERVVTCGLNGYQLATGTSFAAPFVSAAAALLVSRARRRSYVLSSEGVRRLLSETATPWPNKEIMGYGSGILNAAAALAALDREVDSSTPAELEPDAPDFLQ
jgi:subtilisin family serine protease